MGAILCSENDLSLLANLHSDMVPVREAAFRILLAENLRSLAKRYPDLDDHYRRLAKAMRRHQTSPDILIAQALARKRPGHGAIVIEPVALWTQVVMICDFYDHQACECLDYHTTKAREIVGQIRQDAYERDGLSEGRLYQSSLWGLE